MEKSLLVAKLHGKTSIVVKDAPGFAVNRFFVPFLNEAARMLEEDPAHCLVVEDAISGVRAGKAAGARVLALTTSFSDQELSEADWITSTLATASMEVLDW